MTRKQARFCNEYIIDHVGAYAAIRAGYAKTNAKQTANEILTYPDCKALIAQLEMEVAERNKVKTDEIINNLREIAA